METMSKNRRTRARAATSQKNFVGDSFQNLITRTGKGSGNAADGGTYSFSPVSRNRVVLEQAYRSSWIAGKAVDAFAEDMTREGVEVKCDLKPEDLESRLNGLAIWDRIKSAVKWSRLYGGSIAVLMIDGQDPKTPLNFDRIGDGAFRGLMVFDRWTALPTLTDLVTDYNINFGKPKYYDILPDAAGLPRMRIHYSRVIRLEGVELPYMQKISENGWGISVLERLWDRMLAFDSTTEGAAQMVYKAHLRTYGVKGLREIIAAGGKAFEGLAKQIEMIRAYQSNEGITLMDGEDVFEAHQYSFGGLSDMMLQFGQQVAGAIDMPLVRLFGQSPAGLNATGESDMRIYYDTIKQRQEADLRDGITRIYRCAFMSILGIDMPEDFRFKFNPLWQINDTEKASIAGSVATAVNTTFESGIITRHTALKELRQSSEVTGIFSNITDEDIKEAEDEPPPSLNENENDDPQDPGADNAKKPTADAGFDESKHPRKENGQFGKGGGSGSTSAPGKIASAYAMGGKDKQGNERAPGLDAKERKLESRFYRAIDKHPDVLIEAYHKANGNVIDPDEVKKLNPEFASNPDLARAVHEPSSKLAKMIYAQALEAKAARGDTSPTIFTAGGSGSGKSATSPVAKKLMGAADDGLVYDSTLSSFDSAKSRIDQALSVTGGDVGIVYTNTPLERAFEFNLKRIRSVSIDTLIHAHHGASKAIGKILKHYENNPRVNVMIINNRSEGVSEGSIKDVPKYEVFSMREQLVRKAKAMLDAGEMTQAKYNLLIR
jgi:phage-related protein (TIGR01555 family)